MKKIILTGDRPTGKLHIGHYVGSLRNRLLLQEEGNYDKMYVFLADSQALTDNYDNPEKIRENIKEVMLDYLAVGLDPKKVTFFVQSMIPELTEYTFYFMNLVTVPRLLRNPTVKQESKDKGMEEIPSGFLNYPVSQAADILLFNTTLVPAGEDQKPMIEQANEIARRFNYIYNTDILNECNILLPKNKSCLRLPGTDGKNKMSKSIGNCIYLSDTEEELKKKVMSMYTDPNHIRIEDPGNIEGNTVFTYLDCFVKEDSFSKYLPEYNNLEELKEHYKKGGLGDVKIKKFLFNVLNEELKPIRERRIELEKDIDYIYDVLKQGTEDARKIAIKNMKEFKHAMKIDYFD